MAAEPVIISFREKARDIRQRECQHHTIEIDESRWEITCADCGEILNPIWWLLRLAREERVKQFQVDTLNEYIANRTRVKCRHCGKFTPIS